MHIYAYPYILQCAVLYKMWFLWYSYLINIFNFVIIFIGIINEVRTLQLVCSVSQS